MKKELMILFILAFTSLGAAFAADEDTLWTKKIWPEEVKSFMFSTDGFV